MIAPGLHALPCGVDFPRAFVAGLLAQMADHPPEALARVTIYLNAGRMKRAVEAALADHGALILPRLRLISDIGADPLAPFPPAIPTLRRRLELEQLVTRLAAGQPDIAAGPSSFALADSLAALLQEMQMEGVRPADLAALDVATHAAHWQRNLQFLNLITPLFDEAAPLDLAGRQARGTDWLLSRWQAAPPADPVIVAGSTGSRGATRRLLEAVAALPNGAVVLPGFDPHMPDAVWAALEGEDLPAEDHPQYRFAALLRARDLRPSEVPLWPAPGVTGAPVPERAALVSMALRPAPVTDQWMAEGPDLPALAPAMAGVTLLEAPDPRLEAAAIALILRDAVERGQTAALISAGGGLARRVVAALGRWGIVPDDSGGAPLQQTAPGRLLRHVAGAFGRRIGVEQILVILKHPLSATGGARGPHLLHSRELELHLRRHGPAFPGPEDLADWAARKEGRGPWAAWLGRVVAALDHPPAPRPLAAWLADLRAAAELIAAGPAPEQESGLWGQDEGAKTRDLLAALEDESDAGGDLSAPDFAALVSGLMSGMSARPGVAADPRVVIRGTQEARVAGADLVVLGGLTEGSWPGQPAPDPWLSRPMRAAAGLLLPDRRIGLQAHDFQQAINAPRVVLSRALRDAEAEVVPSRWLNRITNLLGGLPGQGGPEELASSRARGGRWIALARALDAPRADLPAAVTTSPARPAPAPPVALRPRKLAVTDITRLIRDPYAIYAKHILRLRPLDALRPEPDAALRGTALHAIAERFINTRPDAPEPPDQARARLRALTEEVLVRDIPWPTERMFWAARMAALADPLIAAEQARTPRIAQSFTEITGALSLPRQGFTLTAKADRIDRLTDGTLAIYDYKSGQVPSIRAAERYDLQLFLEAVMARAGAFERVGPGEVSDLRYIRLGGDARETDLSAGLDGLPRFAARLADLVAAYGQDGTGYAARRAMQKTDDRSDYDGLSRYGEWDLSASWQAEEVA